MIYTGIIPEEIPAPLLFEFASRLVYSHHLAFAVNPISVEEWTSDLMTTLESEYLHYLLISQHPKASMMASTLHSPPKDRAHRSLLDIVAAGFSKAYRFFKIDHIIRDLDMSLPPNTLAPEFSLT